MELEEENQGKTLKEYLLIIKRRKYQIVVPFVVLFALSALIAMILPPVYRSEATILIEQQHIPVDLVKSTVVSFADERIHQIQQKIMRIDNINKIIGKYSLYIDQRKQLSSTELAETFSDNVILDLVSADVISNGRKSAATLAFTLSYDHKIPETAQRVANELVTMFLSENTRTRTEAAKETTVFLQEESTKVKMQIQKLENDFAEYKDQYSESLPELQPVNMASITRIENQLQQLSLQERMLNERKASLRSQLAMTSPANISAVGQQEVVVSLPLLEEEYGRLLNKYSKSHPDVKAMKRRIENFEPTTSKSSAGRISNPIYLQLRNEIQMANVEGTNIVNTRTKLMETLNKLERNLSQTHQVERGYNDLMRDLEGHRAKYTELKAKYMDAKLAQTLEEEQKAEKFSILEPPRVPTRPEKPNRIKIIFMGLLLSTLVGLGLGFLAEAMDASIRNQRELIQVIGEEPLVVIPYLVNDDDLARTRKNMFNFLMIGLLLFVSMLVAIHFFYMHLDLIFYKVLLKAEKLLGS